MIKVEVESAFCQTALTGNLSARIKFANSKKILEAYENLCQLLWQEHIELKAINLEICGYPEAIGLDSKGQIVCTEIRELHDQ